MAIGITDFIQDDIHRRQKYIFNSIKQSSLNSISIILNIPFRLERRKGYKDYLIFKVITPSGSLPFRGGPGRGLNSSHSVNNRNNLNGMRYVIVRRIAIGQVGLFFALAGDL